MISRIESRKFSLVEATYHRLLDLRNVKGIEILHEKYFRVREKNPKFLAGKGINVLIACEDIVKT